MDGQAGRLVCRPCLRPSQMSPSPDYQAKSCIFVCLARLRYGTVNYKQRSPQVLFLHSRSELFELG